MTIDCTDAKRQFSEYFDGRLPRAIETELEAHFQSCAACAGEWATYDMVFNAVRAVPPTTSDAPPPFPSSADAFASRSRGLSPQGKWAASAAAILLCLVVGRFGYQLGHIHAGDGGGGRTDTDVASAPIMPIGWPSKPAGERLRRAANATEHLAWLVDASSRLGDPDRAAESVYRYLRLSPLIEDAQQLASFERTNLGDWVDPTHALSAEILEVTQHIESELGRRRADVGTLQRTLAVVRNSRLKPCLDAIENVVARFDPLPLPQLEDVGVELPSVLYPEDDLFVRGIVYSVTGQLENGGRTLKRFVASHASSPLAPVARYYLLGNGIEIAGAVEDHRAITIFQGAAGIGTKWVFPAPSMRLAIPDSGSGRIAITVQEEREPVLRVRERRKL